MEEGLKINLNLKVLPQTLCSLRFTEIKNGKQKLGKMDENFNIFRSSYKIYSKPEFWNFSFGHTFLHSFCKVLVSSRTALSYVLLRSDLSNNSLLVSSPNIDKHIVCWYSQRMAFNLLKFLLPPTLFIPDGFV